MDLRLVTAAVLLLGTSAFAQLPIPGASPKPAPAAQDPDKPQPSPEQVLQELKAERDRLAREIAYVKDRARNAKSLLSDKLANKAPTWKAIDAGTNAPALQPMAMPAAPRLARVATKEELGNHANDTLLIVNGRAIPQRAFDEIMQYLAQSPASGDESLRAQRALFDLIRIEAIASSFEDNEAAERVGGILGQLDGGKTMAEMAKAIGTVPGSSPEGTIEVTRNSVFGPRFEQIAFAAEPGQRVRPFRNANGLVILKVDRFVKGETPDQDKVVGTAIQVPYSPDPQALQKSHLAVNTGQVDILARDQQAFDMLPEMFRRPTGGVAPAPLPTQHVDTTAIMKQLEQLGADMAALQNKTDDESKAKLQVLQQQYGELKRQLRSAEAGGQSPDEIKLDTVPAKPPVKKN